MKYKMREIIMSRLFMTGAAWQFPPYLVIYLINIFTDPENSAAIHAA